MTDFIAAVARRALTRPAIRPRLASRFEAVDAQERSVPTPSKLVLEPPGPPQVTAALRPSHELQSAGPNLAPPSERAPRAPAAAAARAQSIEAPAAAAAAVPQPRPPMLAEPASLLSRVASEALARAPLEAGHKAAASPFEREPAREKPLVERISHTRVESHEVLREHIARSVERIGPEVAVAPREVARPAATRSMPGAVAPLPAVADVRQIEINIGRIEILPASEPAQVREQPAARPAPQSLESYLDERRGRGARA